MIKDGSEGRRKSKIVTSIQNPESHATNKKSDFEYNEYEYPTSNGRPVREESEENEHPEQSYVHPKSFPGPKKPGYSAGSGLRSIAQGSADQANSAVANQHAAAKQAAYVAQNTLAQAASQAAATAQVCDMD